MVGQEQQEPLLPGPSFSDHCPLGAAVAVVAAAAALSPPPPWPAAAAAGAAGCHPSFSSGAAPQPPLACPTFPEGCTSA
eukprot:1157424-Pelagomonas_calceolata.AAC.6